MEDTAMDEKPPPTRHRSSLRATFGYAFAGIAVAVRTQRNMKIHLVTAVLALILCAVLRLAPVEWAIILICIGLVLTTEMLNTAIEAVVDLVSPEFHPLAKQAKDIGAGMVLVCSILAVMAGAIIYVTALLRLAG
jgi:diacylglycerol kinase